MLVNNFLKYSDVVRQNDHLTIDLKRVHLRRLLLWANNTPLEKAVEISPSLPAYLANSLGELTGRPLSPVFMNDVCATSRAFFSWCRREHQETFSSIPIDWIECLRPNKANAMDSEPKKCKHFSIEDVRKILSVKAKTLTDERCQASIAFLFLSGMRIKAFITLPISCVDLENFKIYQLPSRGVATKFHKGAVTSFLQIPDLLEVIRAWDKRIREIFPPNQTWYAPVRSSYRETGVFNISDNKASPNREKEFRKELKRLCDRAGIPYLSPHKLRHGFAIYGIKHARDMKELKAISQNLMHESISITDGIYGNLNEDDIRDTLAGFTDEQNPGKDVNSNTQDLITALLKLQQNPDLLKRLIEA